ncbi:YetF domain-containing protein [Effusibacillus consociatus]|uniref:YetF domain-containing protein n=1 Tax=Effusibacillus consociatus TaxID=1117041 RepID=A0ABV9Q6U9_9BACL
MDSSSPLYLIRRGEILHENLIRIGRNEPWMRERLQDLEVYDMRQVRYAHLDHKGDLHVHLKV